MYSTYIIHIYIYICMYTEREREIYIRRTLRRGPR